VLCAPTNIIARERMPNYRRDYSGICWFFTVVTQGRRPIFNDPEAQELLRQSIVRCRERYPFEIDAWVTLPDHIHCIWTMPETDRDYSRRWSIIKRYFTQAFREIVTEIPPYWQDRFWAHRIDDDADYQHHVDYIHINPVKHGYVQSPGMWELSSFQRFLARGIYTRDWGVNVVIPKNVGNE
jgi:putative transposase